MSQEVQLVLAQCSHCGVNTTAPSGYRSLIFCTENCRNCYNEKKRTEYLDAEAAKFLARCPDYYPCEANSRILDEFLSQLDLEPSAENLVGAYEHLSKREKLLGKLTIKDVGAMDSPTYDARLRIDPAMGGTLEEIEKMGNAKFAAPQAYSTGGIHWRTMQRANFNELQRQADSRASRRRR